MIVKVKEGYRVISHRTGRNMGTYKSKSDAVKRLVQLKIFGGKR